MDPATVPSPKRMRSAEDFDIIIGLLGFWVVALFVLTVALEFTGEPSRALAPALILLAVALALWGMIRLRKTLPARTSKRRG